MYCKKCRYWWEDYMCDSIELIQLQKIFLHMDKNMLFCIKDWDSYNQALKFVLNNGKKKKQINRFI